MSDTDEPGDGPIDPRTWVVWDPSAFVSIRPAEPPDEDPHAGMDTLLGVPPPPPPDDEPDDD